MLYLCLSGSFHLFCVNSWRTFCIKYGRGLHSTQCTYIGMIKNWWEELFVALHRRRCFSNLPLWHLSSCSNHGFSPLIYTGRTGLVQSCWFYCQPVTAHRVPLIGAFWCIACETGLVDFNFSPRLERVMISPSGLVGRTIGFLRSCLRFYCPPYTNFPGKRC